MILPPKQLLLSDYRELIKSLPYLDQAFETKRSTWQREQYRCYASFQDFHKGIFVKETVKISRADLFEMAAEEADIAVFSIVLWGYLEIPSDLIILFRRQLSNKTIDD